MATLQELGLKYNTDKAYFHKFCDDYETFLRGKNISVIVEVGIENGSSLRMWSGYYPDAKVIGIDICEDKLINEGNITSYFGDQSSPKETILPYIHGCDLFIDDGSHLWNHQVNTFEAVFPFMREGSVYIMEDLHTSLLIGSMYDTNTTNPLEYIKKFVLNNDNISYKLIENNNQDSLSMIIEKLPF